MLRSFRFAYAAAAFLSLASLASGASAAAKNIVLVHGVGMDGSNWHAVYKILKAKGYEVSIVQQPLTGFDEDVKATKRVIDRQKGAVVLVGHSYGGMVITTAGNDPKVKALVYVAAFQPDTGESLGSLSAMIPAAYDPEGRIVGPDGYVSFTKEVFLRDVGQDLPTDEAEYLVASQTPTSGTAFTAVTTDPAWRHTPSYGVVATQDRTVAPELERWMYKRSGAKITEVAASHMIVMSQPQAVADVIARAARAVK